MELTALKHVISAEAAAPGGAYSHAVTTGRLVFTAGQTGVDPRTGELVETLAAQVEQALDNLELVLAAAGSDVSQVLKTTCLLRDIADFATFNEIYARRFAKPYPARSTFGVQFAGNLLFEIEAVAISANVS